MEKTSNNLSNVRFLTQLALLAAVIILMALTPIGYIRTPILTVTLITIPVAVGAIDATRPSYVPYAVLTVAVIPSLTL